MKITLTNLLNNLKPAMEELESTNLPFKVSYRIAKLLKDIESNEDFYLSSFRKLVQEYAEKDKDGNPIVDERGNMPIIQGKAVEFHSKEDELNSLEVEVTDLLLTEDDLESAEITPKAAMALIPYLAE